MAHIDNQTRTLEEETAAEARENEQVEDEDEAAAEAARVNEARPNERSETHEASDPHESDGRDDKPAAAGTVLVREFEHDLG
jgi:hypothetical protein